MSIKKDNTCKEILESFLSIYDDSTLYVKLRLSLNAFQSYAMNNPDIPSYIKAESREFFEYFTFLFSMVEARENQKSRSVSTDELHEILNAYSN